jgi:predicted nuclease of predicted toxin-antitoxin system
MLRQIGHEVTDLRGSGREGLGDSQIFDEAQQNESIFLTTDRDFFHTIPHLYENHHGVIVIALRQPNREAILQKLSWILGYIKASDFANRTIQLRDNTWIAIPPLE